MLGVPPGFFAILHHRIVAITPRGYDNVMSKISSIFVTRLYRAHLSEFGKPLDAEELENSCLAIAEDDEAGQDWCEQNDYAGYTSYASLSDLPWRFPIFKDLVKVLDKHVAAFVEDVAFDLDGKKVTLEDIWINVLPEGGIHTSHIHPHSEISGTTYVAMPEGASAIKFEDVITHPLYSAVSVFDGCPDGLEGILTCQPGCIDDGAHCSVGLRGPH